MTSSSSSGKSVEPRTVSVLGSTGSVGASTEDLLARSPDAFRIEALTARRSVDTLVRQAERLRPRFIAIADHAAYPELKRQLGGTGIELAAGDDAVVAAAERQVDWVMSAIVGTAGLAPTLAAIRQGTTVGLANKECLVSAGALMMQEVEATGAVLLPVDSEHNAIFQAIEGTPNAAIEKIVLTASGGPFRQCSFAEMATKTPAEALAHPNWDMGAKISIDSATMMNKGLEVIEAHHLFGLPSNQIEVLVHPQSAVHGMVYLEDGSVLAELGAPDMRTPIAHVLAWPSRMNAPAERLDLVALGSLTFEAPDLNRFPALRLARDAMEQGGSAPIVLNAANEIAVAAFLDLRLGFTEIVETVASMTETFCPEPPKTVADVLTIDAEARARTSDFLAAPVEARVAIGAPRH
ncbi:MAG: 1-deoxy-D-xylulose-5-phosphate reductoisomerase [Rhodospirillaceae bacterium]|nr:1-deoxy-D-xylulose-5-phosphate reductoisomerase [Rhodospirillaceae bacterium]MBT6138546.1 1-deoxy-D-xylulose-5-phosphate reductoisomerase [Rhodospirillaceae bacterium]